MAPRFVGVAAAASVLCCLGQASAFITTSGSTAQAYPIRSSDAAGLSASCSTFRIVQQQQHQQDRPGAGSARRRWPTGVRDSRRVAHTRQQAHKTTTDDEVSPTTVGGRAADAVADPEGEGGEEMSLLDELLMRCAEATKSDTARESSHTGSSEWAGFKTAPALLEGVRTVLARARMRSRHSDGSAMAWSWLTLSPRPLRVVVATPEDGRVGVYLTVLPAGNGSPPSHRPMYGSHMLSRVLAGEVEQVKSNSQRVIGRSTHSLETPVWSSFGGGARRLINESFQPAVILEVVLYDWSRGASYSGSYAASGTSSTGSAERRAETEGVGRAEAAGAEGDGGGGAGGEGGRKALSPIVAMDECPCDPALLFRDGDVYEEEEEEGEEKGGGLTLVRRDGGGGVVERGRVGGAAGPGAREVEDLFTADDLASDVGGLDGQLEDIVRRVLSTRTIPAELRQALGVSHVRGLLLHGPPGCGKTLLARELGRRLGARPPKLVSGPEILDKWVGEAERKVRLLFLDAELDHERCIQMGEDPAGLPLNLICFDEIDALCRRRGSMSGDTSGVRDSVVNQILSKLDGLVNLENVLVVGMTNRKELLDEALLRPGRMEVSMPIPLPDASGREQILAIHLRRARDAGLVSPEVSDASLAEKTDGFSGADLAGLVRSATSFAIADWRERLDKAGAGTTGTGGADSADVKKIGSGLDGSTLSGGGDKGTIGDPGATGAGGEGQLTSVRCGDSSGGGGGVDDGRGLEITVQNFERALREVEASDGGRDKWRRRFGRAGAVGGALRDGLGKVLSRPVDDNGG